MRGSSVRMFVSMLMLMSNVDDLRATVLTSTKTRLLHSRPRWSIDDKQGEEVKQEPQSAASQCPSSSGGGASKEEPGRPQSDGPASEGPSSEEDGSSAGDQKQREEKNQPPPPPPPPHGNKTPWQVFAETLRSEFEASKEWKESTKALASSANQFTENESVKRARAAYSAASGAASSTTSTALRSTGQALGKGAAWTWETPVVKGVRAGVSATGKAIEKGTRPVRETEVYKKAVGEVKEVIDDGSSSRYGGWTEKEERRKRRELRAMNEAKASGTRQGRVEKAEEDLECVVRSRSRFAAPFH